MNGRSCSMSLHRTSGTPQGPRMVSGHHIPAIRAHSGTPGPSPCGSTSSSTMGSLANNLHLKMPSGGGMAPQNNVAESPIHLPALSPRRQMLTNGKLRFQVTQAGGMSGSHTLKPKQQEFGSPFPPNPGKGRIVFLGPFKNGNNFFLPHPIFCQQILWKNTWFSVRVKVDGLIMIYSLLSKGVGVYVLKGKGPQW